MTTIGIVGAGGLVAALCLGFLLGFVPLLIWASRRRRALELGASQLQGINDRLMVELENGRAALTDEREARDLAAAALSEEHSRGAVRAERIRSLEEAQQEQRQAFEATAGAALRHNNTTFLELAKEAFRGFAQEAQGESKQRQDALGALLDPVRQQLEKMDTTVRSLESARSQAYGGLTEHLQRLSVAHNELRDETQKLAQSLRSPTVRGRWGELQLRRVVELAGMSRHCDFVEQSAGEASEATGTRLRPDLIVKLPGDRLLVVDAKTPLGSYMEAMEHTDPERQKQALRGHAKQLRRHMRGLSGKAYWRQFPQAPEFVVMFVPGEAFFSAALEQDPELIESGVASRVMLATPTTFIALLRAVAFGWQREQVGRNAEMISELGRALYGRLQVLVKNFSGIRRGLDAAVGAYNDSVGSLESRVLVSARRLAELGAGVGDELESPGFIDREARALRVERTNDQDPVRLVEPAPGRPSESLSTEPQAAPQPPAPPNRL